MPKQPLAAEIGKIKAVIEEVNTSVNPPVAHVREAATGGAITVDLSIGPAGTYVTPSVGEVWWIQFLGTRWTLLTKIDSTRSGGYSSGSSALPGTSDYVKLLFGTFEQESEIVYKAILNFNSAGVNFSVANSNNSPIISHYIINWVSCDENGVVDSTVRANQYIWYPNKDTDGADIAVDPDPTDTFDYVVVVPTPLENPKVSYYKARIRAVTVNGLMGAWTTWTTPSLPIRDTYTVPPKVEGVTLAFQVSENDDGSLQYNGVIRFKDVGFWDLPGGDFVDDIDRYEIQLEPLELNSTTYGQLNSSITAVATSLTITLASAVTVPSGQFLITIDDEVMQVTSRSGNTWTVLRAQGSSTASAHSSRRAIKAYIDPNPADPELININDLVRASQDKLGTLNQPQIVLDMDDEGSWPFLGLLEAEFDTYIAPSDTELLIKIDPLDVALINQINTINLTKGISIRIDTEVIKIIDIFEEDSIDGYNVYRLTVVRGQSSTQANNHYQDSSIYIQSWLPAFSLVDAVTTEQNFVRVIKLGDVTANTSGGNKYSIKINNEIMRVFKQSSVGTDGQGRTIYQLDVNRGMQNTPVTPHASNNTNTVYYSLGNYYSHMVTAIPDPNKYWWRAHVRAVDRFNRKGEWSDWTNIYKASQYASALPPAPTEIALGFTRAHRDRAWDITCEVSFNEVNYDIPGGDSVSDVAGYQTRLFHSDGAYLKETVSSTATTLKIIEPDRGGNNQRQLAGNGTGTIVLFKIPDNPNIAVASDCYEIMQVTASSFSEAQGYWEYTVVRGLNPLSFTVDPDSPLYVFYFPSQNTNTSVTAADKINGRYTTTFAPVRKQWWYVAQVRTLDTKNRVGAWSVPTYYGTASDTTRPPVPFNLSVEPFDNDTVRLSWDAPSEPGVGIPPDFFTLLNNSESPLESDDFQILSKDISYFKIQLWSEDPHQEIPLSARSFGINSIGIDFGTSNTIVTFDTDLISAPKQIIVTSAKLASNKVTLFTAVPHGLVLNNSKTINVDGIGIQFDGSFLVTEVGYKTISYESYYPDVEQFNITDPSAVDVNFTESLTDWFETEQIVYINNCSPLILNGRQVISEVTDTEFSITLPVGSINEDEEVDKFDATVSPFEEVQALDYYSTYPIHYFNCNLKSNLVNLITAGIGDICYVTDNVNTVNQGYWKLTGNNPRDILAWTKITNNEFAVNGLQFFDSYVATTSRTISANGLPNKVWVRVCSVDSSGNSSAWVVAGPFFTQNIYKPQNVLLDFDEILDPNAVLPSSDVDGGAPSTTNFSAEFDGALPETTNFLTVIDGIENADVKSLKIQWNEVADAEASVNGYNVELQGGRMYAQIWQDSLEYWGKSVSKDVVYGGLASSVGIDDTTLNVTELSNAPAPEFYIRVGNEIMKVTQAVRDWDDDYKLYKDAIYEVERGSLGTKAEPHNVTALVIRVQVETLQVLEMTPPVDVVPFRIAIGGEKLTVIARDLNTLQNDFDNIYNYRCLRERKNGNSLADFEHDGINYRIPIFDQLVESIQTVPSSSDLIDQDDIAQASFGVLNLDLFYRGRVRSTFNTGEIGTWSEWTFWADPTDLVEPRTPENFVGSFSEDGLSLNLSWEDAYRNDYVYEPTIFNNIHSESQMLGLNAIAGDIVVRDDTNSLRAFILTDEPHGDLENWRQTLVPLTNIGTFDERILPEGSEQIGGALEETDYYEIQVSRVPKAGKSVNGEGQIGLLLDTLVDGTGDDGWSIYIDPLTLLPKYPKVGDKLQISSSEFDFEVVTIKSIPTNWNAARVKIDIIRNESGTSPHPVGSIVKWIDITSGDFLNNYETSFEYIYLWKHDPLYLPTSVQYILDDIGDYLYAARVRARDAAGNSSDWVEITIKPDGLPIPEVTDLVFDQLANTDSALDAELTFQCDISPEYNITHFVPELMPALRTRLLNSLTSSGSKIYINVDSGIPNPNNLTNETDPGIGPYLGFIDDEAVLVTSRTIMSGYPNSGTSTTDVYELIIERAQKLGEDTEEQDAYQTKAVAHASGSWFQWFYHPNIKQIEYGISYGGAIGTADIEPNSGTLIGTSNTLAQFVAPFNDVIKVGIWYQGRAKSMAGTVSSAWSNWSDPLRAIDQASLEVRPPSGPGAPTEPSAPNPVRNLIIDVDVHKVHVSWLAPKPNDINNPTSSTAATVNSLVISTIEEYNGTITNNNFTQDDLDAILIEAGFDTTDQSGHIVIPALAKVTTTTAHEFYSAGKWIPQYSVTYAASANTINFSNVHQLIEGTAVKFTELSSTGSGLSTSNTYYVTNVNSSALTMQLKSSLSASSVIDILNNGSGIIEAPSTSVYVPPDEVSIDGIYDPFSGIFPILKVINSTSFVIPIEIPEDGVTYYDRLNPISGSLTTIDDSGNTIGAAVVALDLSGASTSPNNAWAEIDHYIVALKTTKKDANGVYKPTWTEIKSGTKWAPSTKIDRNVTNLIKTFALNSPARDRIFYAKVRAVNKAGKKSVSRYARGNKIDPPKPRIQSLVFIAGTNSGRCNAKIKIDQTNKIIDKDIVKYHVEWFTAKTKDRDPRSVQHRHPKSVSADWIRKGKGIFVKGLKHSTPDHPKFFFVRIRAEDERGNLSEWTYWRCKKIVTNNPSD